MGVAPNVRYRSKPTVDVSTSMLTSTSTNRTAAWSCFAQLTTPSFRTGTLATMSPCLMVVAGEVGDVAAETPPRVLVLRLAAQVVDPVPARAVPHVQEPLHLRPAVAPQRCQAVVRCGSAVAATGTAAGHDQFRLLIEVDAA